MERTLTQLPFWSSLTEHEMETLRRSAFVRHYEKGAFVHSSDNECLGMDTDVLIIPANVIAALKEKNLYVRCFLYELATKRFSDVMWAMQQIMFKGLDRRLAEFLLAEAERTGSDTIRITHGYL